jgi:hypothetical protein
MSEQYLNAELNRINYRTAIRQYHRRKLKLSLTSSQYKKPNRLALIPVNVV